jgi:hypothetical protein
MGPAGTYSIAFDINNNPVPFGWHQLIGSYVVTNSDGSVAKVASFVNVLFLKPGELVNRQPLFINAMSQVLFSTAGCTGNVAYVALNSVIYTGSNGVATLDAAPAINTPVTLSFWRYDMTTAPITNLVPASARLSNGTCQSNPAAPSSAIKVDRGASLTFLNALWPVSPRSCRPRQVHPRRLPRSQTERFAWGRGRLASKGDGIALPSWADARNAMRSERAGRRSCRLSWDESRRA